MAEGSEDVPVSAIQMIGETDRISLSFQKPGPCPACLGCWAEPAPLISRGLKHNIRRVLVWAPAGNPG